MFPVARLAPAAENWLCAAENPRLLHVFPQALNLTDARAGILSIVHPALGAGPFAAVLAQPVDFSPAVAVDSPVRVGKRLLETGEWIFLFDNAAKWNPCPNWKDLTPDGLRWAIPHIEAETAHPERQTPLTIFHFSPSGDAAALETLASSLAGRGPGLTPAGDDFLVGVMHALWAVGAPSEAARLCGVIAAAAVPRTTSLSGAWLNAAARGEAAERWHVLFDEIARKNETGLRMAVRSILQTGHTSGADALAGFMAQTRRGLG
jgi:hypothetical protein